MPPFYDLHGAKTEEDASRMAKALIRGTTCLNLESISGRSVIDVARSRGFASVASYIEAQRKEPGPESGQEV